MCLMTEGASPEKFKDGFFSEVSCNLLHSIPLGCLTLYI